MMKKCDSLSFLRNYIKADAFSFIAKLNYVSHSRSLVQFIIVILLFKLIGKVTLKTYSFATDFVLRELSDLLQHMVHN